MEALANFGDGVCSYWKAGNDNLAYAVGVNPDAIAAGEIAGALTALGARYFKVFGNKGLGALAYLTLLGPQTSVGLQQFFCGNPSTAKALDSQIRDFNQFQYSVPQRAYDTTASAAQNAWDAVFGPSDSNSASSSKPTPTPTTPPTTPPSTDSNNKKSDDL